MNPMTAVMKNLVPVSAFNQGKAGEIFSAVKTTGQPKLVLRRNTPECVLVSPEEYTAMVEELEDLRDYKLAVERLASSSAGEGTDWANLLRAAGVTQKDLAAMEDVELA